MNIRYAPCKGPAVIQSHVLVALASGDIGSAYLALGNCRFGERGSANTDEGKSLAVVGGCKLRDVLRVLAVRNLKSYKKG